ncbi:MAG: hypothetical protein FWH21_05180 [Kiritimatiellaeota bacterium]|nr:hypothetical protein [Kiritimatiellota bacterium]
MTVQQRKMTAAAGFAIFVLAQTSAQVVAQWNFNSPLLPGGPQNYGPDPYLPATIAPGFSTGGLRRGNGVSANQYSGMKNAWGGYRFTNATESAAVSSESYFYFSLTNGTASPLPVTGIQTTLYKSSSGPTSAQWQYCLDGGTWQDIGGIISLPSGNSLYPYDRSWPAVNVSASSFILFRLMAWGGTATGQARGTFYFDGSHHGSMRTLTVLTTADTGILPHPDMDDPHSSLVNVPVTAITVSPDNVATLEWEPLNGAFTYFIYGKCSLTDEEAFWTGISVETPNVSNGKMSADFTLGDGSHTDYRFFTMRALEKSPDPAH